MSQRLNNNNNIPNGSNGTSNNYYSQSSPSFHPAAPSNMGAPLHQQQGGYPQPLLHQHQQHHPQQPMPYLPGYNAPSLMGPAAAAAPNSQAYYQYASVYHDPNMTQYNPYINQFSQMYLSQPMPPAPYYAASQPSSVPSTASTNTPMTTSATPKKKMQYSNQQFIPQKDHNQYLQRANNNNFSPSYNQPPQTNNNNNNSINNNHNNSIDSPISASSIGQTSPDPATLTSASSPPSSTKSSTPKLSNPSTNSIDNNKSTPELVNGNFNGFTVISGAVDAANKPPFFYGTTKDKLLSQKSKFKAIKESKQLKEEQEKIGENVIEIEVQMENDEESIKKEIPEHVGVVPKEQESITTPSPQVSKPGLAWATIAQQAAKKNSPKSVTPSSIASSSPVTKKEELRYVPSVSNVLEPLGVVVLRSMFDTTFQKMFVNNSAKFPKIVPRGLVNTGNICFMSSILQLLLYCQPFYQTLNIISTKTIQSLSRRDSAEPSLVDAIIEFFKNFNIKLDTEDEHKEFGDVFAPEQFYKEISKHSKFKHLQWGQQEDAEEFFGYLLDGLHEEFIESFKNLKDNDVKLLLDSIKDEDSRNLIKQSLEKSNEEDFKSKNESNNKNNIVSDDGWLEVSGGKKKVSAKRTVEVKPSPIRQLFGGQFRSVLDVPKQREAQSITVDPFQQVSLDISDESIQTLEDAFKRLSQPEEIPYKTEDGTDVLAKKQTFLDKFPDVLIVQLKRFEFVNKNTDQPINGYSSNNNYYNSSAGRIEKIRKKIKYEHDFTIPLECMTVQTRKFTPVLNYKLIGVVYHHGISSEGGHYTVDVLRNDLGKWIRIDDTMITELKPEEVLIAGGEENVKTAYILMYQKVN